MDKEALKNYLEKGSEIAGGAVGGAIGLIGGPAGAVLGGALGAGFVVGIKEFIHRSLSNRQQMRVAASTAYMLTGVKSKLDSGYKIRSDDFFKQGDGRSSAEELFEGILLKCKDAYEEKKIAYISKIFEEAIFEESMNAQMLNQILTAAENFTYRKLCIISFFGRKSDFNCSNLMKEPYGYYDQAVFSKSLELLLQDTYDLVNMGIVDQSNNAIFNRYDIMPGQFSLTPLGQVYFDLMGLKDIPMAELEQIYEHFQYNESFGFNEKV